MPHIRGEVPLRICSKKVKYHGSTSRVRSLAKRIIGLFKTPPELHTSILKTPHKPSCIKRIARRRNDCLKDSPTTLLKVLRPS